MFLRLTFLMLLSELRLCQSYMEAHMDPSNCIGLYCWARDLGATDLSDCALRFICQHFTQVGLSVWQAILT